MIYVSYFLQVFTNSDETYAKKVIHMLGLEVCFERIISFETLNPSYKLDTSDNKDGSDQPSSKGIFDFYEYISKPDPDVVLPKTPVVCKPFQDSYEKVFKMADIDPKKTVRSLVLS